MQSAFLLSGLESRYPPQISARIVAALRQDDLVWSALEDEDFYQRAMEAERGAPLFWTPANLGLILLGGEIKAESLASAGFPALDPGLRQQSLRTYEEAARLGTSPGHLRDAVLLALALRERRRTMGNWSGLPNELLFGSVDGRQVNSRMWKTVLAILYGIISDPNDLLVVLLNARDVRVAAEWVLHCILTIPLEEAEQSRKIAALLAEMPAGKQIEVLKSARAHGKDELAARTANLLLNGHPLFVNFKMKSDLDQAAPESLAARVLTLQQLSTFNQLAGSPAQAEACLRIARSVLAYWQAGLEIETLDVQAENAGPVIEPEAVDGLAARLPGSKRLVYELAPKFLESPERLPSIQKLDNTPDHPMILLGKALNCLKEGDCGIARELGLRATSSFLDMVRTEERPFVGEFAMQWNPIGFIDGLLALDLVDEAEVCAEAILELRPTDVVLLGRHADLLAKRGKYRRAKSQMRLAVALVPNSVELRRKLAETDERSGDWNEAFVHRKNILAFSESEDAQDKLAYARAAIHAGKFDHAVESCSQILASDPEHAGAHGLMGMACEKLGEIEKAVAHLNRATLIQPEEAEWWLALANLHRAAGDRRQANETLRAGVMAAPEAGGVYFGLGEMLLEDGLTSEALPYLRRANELAPEDEKICLQLSKALHHLGHLNEARFVMERMRGKWSMQPDLAYEFASLAYDLGDLEGAIPGFEVAVRSDNPRTEWLIKYSGLLLDDRLAKNLDETRSGLRLGQAEIMLQKALAVKPDDIEGRILLADALRKQGVYEKALELYKTLAEDQAGIEPEQIWRVQHGLGLTALELNLTDPALASIRDAAARRPGDLRMQHDLARAYLQAKLLKEAERTAENGLDLAPDDLSNLDWFAEMMGKVGRPERAEEALRTAVDLAPDNPELRLRLAQVQLQNGNLNDVRSTLGQLTTEMSAGPETLRQAAYVYLRMEDLPAALSCLERASHAMPQPPVDLLYDLAKLYDQMGETREALSTIQQAVKSPLKDAKVFIYQADLLTRERQADQAQTALEKALILAQDESDEKRIPLEATIYRMMATGMLRAGSREEALRNASMALERSPADPILRTETAELALEMLNFDLAERTAELPKETLDIGGERSSYLALISAEAALEHGDLPKALASWQEAAGKVGWAAWQSSVEARLDIRRGDWVRAGEIARRAVAQAFASEGDNRTQILYAGKAAIEAGLWEDGLNCLETFIEEYPTDPRGPFELGKAYILAAECQRDSRELLCVNHAPGEEALSGASQARCKDLLEQVAAATQSVDALRWLARLGIAFSPTVQSLKDFSRVALPVVDTAAIVRAIRASGNWPAAALAGQQALDSVETQIQMGLGYIEEDPERGLQIIGSLSEKMPRHPILQMVKHLLAAKLGRDNEAEAALEKGLEYWPDEPLWRARAACLAENRLDWAGAVYHWKSAAQLSPAQPDYAMQLGRAFARLGQYPEAVEALERAARLNPARKDAWLELAEAAKNAGMLPQAMDAAQRASEVDSNDIRGVLLTSEIAREMGDGDAAAEYARLALRREPNNPKAVLAVSQAMTQQGDEDQGLAIIEEKIAELPPSLPLMFERARLVYKLKGAPAASGLLAKLAQNHPEDAEIMAMLARVQLESGDKKGAELSALKSLRLKTDQPALSLMLGRIEREMGQLDQAVYYLTEAIRMQPRDPEGYLELGQTYLDRREHGAALEVFRQAIQAAPDDKRGYYQAAAIFKDSKDYQSAEKMLQHAAKLDPEDLQIRRQLIAVMALNLIHKSQEANSPV